MIIKAVTSAVIIPLDGLYRVVTLNEVEARNLCESQVETQDGVLIPYYIGHPATAAIAVKSLNNTVDKATSNLFEGLEPGESLISLALKPGVSTRRTEGFTQPHQEATVDDIWFRLTTRIE